MRKAAFPLFIVLCCLTASANTDSPISIASLNQPYEENFNSLVSTGTGTLAAATPTGWGFSESGTNANTTYTAANGSINAGDTYSFGATDSTERALGQVRSGTLIPTIGAAYTNATGGTITSLAISYTGEQWRVGGAHNPNPERLDFQYSLDATSLSTGSWIDVNALDFLPPVAAAGTVILDGNAAANRVMLSSTINNLNIPAGARFFIRWADADASGADDGLAIDDFSITAGGTGPSTTVAINDVTIDEGNSGTTVATFTVTANGSHPNGITVDVATADGTAGNAALAADGDYNANSASLTIAANVSTATFEVVINGDTKFEQDEQFTVNLSNVVGATIADAQGIGTIKNDDPVTSDIVISQVYGGGGNSQATLTNDFIELFNRGTSTISLAGWSVQYLSATGTGTWSVTPLTGSMAPGTYYLIQQAAGTGGTTPLPTPDASGSIPMAAGAGKVALLNTATAAVGQCPAFASTLDLVGYGGANCSEGAPTAPPGNQTAALRKRGGCFDSNRNDVDFAVNSPLPRNSASPVRSCTFQTAAIDEIQGDDAQTPLLGLDVQTTGIVTARKSNGFFIQAASDEDSNPQTSEGLFVFTSSQPAVAVGDVVAARGTASEFFNLTQLESSLPGDVTIESSGNALPGPIMLTAAILDANGTFDQLERFEGMRVHADALVSVGPTDEFGETPTVLEGVARPMREPGIEQGLPVPPDPSTGVVDCCIPIWDTNPERIVIDSDGLIGAVAISVTSNVVFGNVTGPLDFTFGQYKVLPELAPATSASMSAVAVPMALPDELTIGGFNIENFVNNATQRRKAALAIRTVMRSPDVIGHIEILDQPVLQALAQQVNEDAVAAGEPNPGYQAYLIKAPSEMNTQNVGFLVKTSRVTGVSVTQELADQTLPGGAILHDRPPLVLRAKVQLPGRAPRPFIVVVNHLRSFIDIELLSSEGDRVRAKRTAQAEAVATLLQSLQSANPGVPVLSIGDYNAYQFNDGYTDPISILKGTPTVDEEIVVDQSPDLVDPDFINLTDALPAPQQYSFVFEGTPQALDHVLVNTVAGSLVTRYAVARANADFPDSALLINDATRPERSSDHDMPVAYLSFPITADLSLSVSGPAAPVQTGSALSYSVEVVNHGPDTVPVTVTIPATPGLLFNAIAAPAGWTCASPAPGASGPISCTIPSFESTAAASFTVTATLGCGVADGAVLTQAASVASSALDPIADNTGAVLIVASNPPPVINGVISPIVVAPVAGTTPPGAVVSDAQLGSPVAVDNCSATIVRTGVPAGNLFPIGSTTVTYTATDSGGATSVATQIVTVMSGLQSLQATAAQVRLLIAASTRAPLTARLTDALKKIEKAIDHLAAANSQHAAIGIRQAMQDIEGLKNQGLLPAAAADALLRQLAGVLWTLN